ncbi:SMP-30/gluconolactonase/LRE family protein [Hahella ganghwensis]|uniref:SMP-30/gluconolactonase/LRE family protein n=1 Tax=Hahella ganghwensis TaxID=286420 RepID=UPI0003758F06|nr:hypothetical protein [Hahella ganghwensis]
MRLHNNFLFSLLSVSIGFASNTALADPLQTDSQQAPVISINGFAQPESVEADRARDYLYISNIAGHPMKEDGVGYISRVHPDGTGLELEWVSGLHAPKGLALDGQRLYVADLRELVVIDVEAGVIIARYPVPQAKMLNGIEVSQSGHVYVSDFLGNTIYHLEEGQLIPWIQGEQLNTPNGLSISGDQLTVVTWGAGIQEDFSTKSPGQFLSISLTDGALSKMNNSPRGNWDGIVRLGDQWLVSDWLSGEVMSVNLSGNTRKILQLEPGSADLGWNPESEVLWVPEMQLGRVTGYKIEL